MKQQRIEGATAPSSSAVQERALSVWIAGVLGVVGIGAVDYVSGAELRTFPLYYAPISWVAWYRGRSAALIIATLCAGSWVASNTLAGLRYSHQGIWVANTLVQAVSFATVGLLIATLRRALAREQGLSRTDPLTSVLNSRAFFEEADRLLAVSRRTQRPVTVAYIDLDNFKTVNDTHGHQAGDDLLRAVADLLRSSIRPSDLLARLGGDEFVLLLPETGPQEAAATLERLRSGLSGALASSRSPVTGSIGAVTFMVAPEDAEYMIQQADSRMYAAKTGGRNRVHLEVATAGGQRERLVVER